MKGTGNSSNTFLWQHSSAALSNYQPWCIGEPNNAGTEGENCGEMCPGNGCLNDQLCNKLRPYLCQRGKVLKIALSVMQLRKLFSIVSKNAKEQKSSGMMCAAGSLDNLKLKHNC